jgi:hypothetical protein
MIMKDQTFTLRFATPAFLGDAEQNGVWRTPPIKALLRQSPHKEGMMKRTFVQEER